MAAHGRIDLSAARLQATTVDQKRMNVRHSSKVRPARNAKKQSPNKTSPNKRAARRDLVVVAARHDGAASACAMEAVRRPRLPRREREQGGAARQRHPYAR